MQRDSVEHGSADYLLACSLLLSPQWLEDFSVRAARHPFVDHQERHSDRDTDVAQPIRESEFPAWKPASGRGIRLFSFGPGDDVPRASASRAVRRERVG